MSDIRKEAEPTITYQLKVPPDLHKAIQLEALKMGMTIRSFILNACQEKLDRKD